LGSKSGVPNPSFRKQEFFIKNQELVRRFFSKKQGENQEIFFAKSGENIRHQIFFCSRNKTVTIANVCNFSRTIRKRPSKREGVKNIFIQDSISFLFLRKMNEKFVLNIVFVN
jgi:hypothetical protein